MHTIATTTPVLTEQSIRLPRNRRELLMLFINLPGGSYVTAEQTLNKKTLIEIHIKKEFDITRYPSRRRTSQ